MVLITEQRLLHPEMRGSPRHRISRVQTSMGLARCLGAAGGGQCLTGRHRQ